MKETTPHNSNRRAALKALAAATGAAGLAALPSRWSKPAVMVGAVPAHAQASCVEYALLIENMTGTLSVNHNPGPDESSSTRRAWTCDGGCLDGVLINIGGTNATFDVAIFGNFFFSITLAPGGQWWFIINRTTFEWDTASSADALDTDRVECFAGE